MKKQPPLCSSKKCVLNNFAELTRNLTGQGSFLGVRHFDKHSSTTQERRALQEKLLAFSSQKNLKDAPSMRNIINRRPQSAGHLFSKSENLSPVCEKGQGISSPSSL